MFPHDFSGFSSLLMRLRSSLTALAAVVGPGRADAWEPLFADDPRSGDEAYEVVFATPRSVN